MTKIISNHSYYLVEAILRFPELNTMSMMRMVNWLKCLKKHILKQRSVSVESRSNVFTFMMSCVLALGFFCRMEPLHAEEGVVLEKKSGAAIQHFIKNYQGGRFTYIVH